MAELRKAKKRTLDFTNVKDRGPFNPKHKEDGEYTGKITAVYETESKVKDDGSGGDDMWVFAFQLDDDRTATYPYYCVMTENQLWKIRNLIESVGLKGPHSRATVDPNKLLNKPVGVMLITDEYEGKMKSVIDSFLAVNGVSSADDEDVEIDDDEEIIDEEEEAPKPKRRAAKKKAPVVEDDDEDDEEEEEPEPPKRKPARKRKPEPVEEDEDDEEDEEEEEPTPKKRAAGRAVKGSAKAPARKKKPVVEEDDDDDLEELDVDDL